MPRKVITWVGTEDVLEGWSWTLITWSSWLLSWVVVGLLPRLFGALPQCNRLDIPLFVFLPSLFPARQGWGTKNPLTTQACTEVRKYKLLDQEIVMPIMRGKIQAILTTDAALLYGWGPLWKSEGRVEIRREMDNTAARQAFNQTRDESCS